MNDKTIDRNGEIEINLQRLFNAVWNKIWQVGLVTVVCAVVAFMSTFYFITPLYQSSAMFYVNNNALSVGNASLSISSADIVASRGLVDSYLVILNTRTTLVDVIDYAGVDRTVGEIKGMLEAEAVNETEIFRVTVTSEDPEEAEEIANAVAYILPKRIDSIIEGSSAKVVDAAVVPSKPSSPSYSKNTLIGAMLGMVAIVGYIVLRELLDITVRGEEDVEQTTSYPILASVPDMTAPGKGGYYYGYGESKRKKSLSKHGRHEPALVGRNINFAASEAYKLLRTKLQFSFADEKSSHVIAVSSALSGEGKSLSAVNLAHSLSQLDKKVILVDCDMRRPSLADKLNIHKYPGLSSYLTRQEKLENLIQRCNLPGEENAFAVISAGQNPPNPIELLSSARMQKLLSLLRGAYDYVILDMPPVVEVSDAMAIAKETDGILLVVRQDYCDRLALGDTIRQFDFINAKILGIVFNCTSESGGKYYNKKYYNKYNKRYYNRPENSYAKAAEKGKRFGKKD